MRKTISTALLGASIALAAPANAATTLAFTPGASAPSTGQALVYDFDSSTPTSLVTGPLVQIKRGAADANGAQPANSRVSGTNYLSVLNGGVATILFSGPVSAFSFDWGSIDTYNILTILPFGGTDSIVVPGTTFTNTTANGNQVTPGTNGLFSVTGTAGTLYRGFTLASTGNSFEIDNVSAVSAASAVPEPAMWLTMILGMGAVGVAMRRRRDVTIRVAYSA
jgi:hypothetical protein